MKFAFCFIWNKLYFLLSVKFARGSPCVPAVSEIVSGSQVVTETGTAEKRSAAGAEGQVKAKFHLLRDVVERDHLTGREGDMDADALQ